MTVKEMRALTGLSQSKFGSLFNIPTKTVQNWESERTHPPKYTVDMMEKILRLEKKI